MFQTANLSPAWIAVAAIAMVVFMALVAALTMGIGLLIVRRKKKPLHQSDGH
jgi:hypothetical protein